MKASGLKRRRIAFLAARGQIPGARRAANGYHFEYFDTREFRCWIADRKIAAIKRNKKNPFEWPKTYLLRPSVKTNVPLALRICFNKWKGDVLEKYPLFEWPVEEVINLKRQLRPFHELWQQINNRSYC